MPLGEVREARPDELFFGGKGVIVLSRPKPPVKKQEDGSRPPEERNQDEPEAKK